MNIGQRVNFELERAQDKFCEDCCPYRLSHAGYDDDYELPCTVGKCFVVEFKNYLVQ